MKVANTTLRWLRLGSLLALQNFYTTAVGNNFAMKGSFWAQNVKIALTLMEIRSDIHIGLPTVQVVLCYNVRELLCTYILLERFHCMHRK